MKPFIRNFIFICVIFACSQLFAENAAQLKSIEVFALHYVSRSITDPPFNPFRWYKNLRDGKRWFKYHMIYRSQKTLDFFAGEFQQRHKFTFNSNYPPLKGRGKLRLLVVFKFADDSEQVLVVSTKWRRWLGSKSSPSNTLIMKLIYLLPSLEFHIPLIGIKTPNLAYFNNLKNCRIYFSFASKVNLSNFKCKDFVEFETTPIKRFELKVDDYVRLKQDASIKYDWIAQIKSGDGSEKLVGCNTQLLMVISNHDFVNAVRLALPLANGSNQLSITNNPNWLF